MMRTTEKPTTERVVLAQFGNGFSLMRMGALGAVLRMLLSQEHRQPDYSELGATARQGGQDEFVLCTDLVFTLRNQPEHYALLMKPIELCLLRIKSRNKIHKCGAIRLLLSPCG